MKFKNFKFFLKESELGEYDLNPKIVNEINKELFKLIKDNEYIEDLGDFFSVVKEVLFKNFDIVVLDKDYRIFKGSLIISKGKENFKISSNETKNDRNEFIPFENVELVLQWGTQNNNLIIKDCHLIMK